MSERYACYTCDRNEWVALSLVVATASHPVPIFKYTLHELLKHVGDVHGKHKLTQIIEVDWRFAFAPCFSDKMFYNKYIGHVPDELEVYKMVAE